MGKEKIVAAVKGIVLQAGRVLLLKRSMQDIHGPGIWEFPGGKLDFGESLQQALAREVAEETGLRVAVGPLLYAAAPVLSPVRQAVVVNYLCEVNGGALRLSHEHDDSHWATAAEMREMLDKTILHNLETNGIFEQLKGLAP